MRWTLQNLIGWQRGKMKRFNYRAKESKTGKLTKGVIQAENEKAAGHFAARAGLYTRSN